MSRSKGRVGRAPGTRPAPRPKNRRERAPLASALAPKELARLGQAFQLRAVVPHCGVCEKPCCRLETLVLELDWKRLRALWKIETHRSSFDAALARGQGPPEIRGQSGFYYAYQRVCPAYAERERACRVYGSPLKPLGCTDFPIFEQDGNLVADLRCEAVDLGELEMFLRRELGDSAVLTVTRDSEFAFLVSVDIRFPPSSARPAASRR